MIRVLVVDDSVTARMMISNILKSDREIEVIAQASNGREAVEFVSRLKPDLITMDINMPVMDGLKATEEIMAYHPTPILIVSTLVKSQMNLAFQAISVGALDTIEKPTAEANARGYQQFIQKVKLLSKIKLSLTLELLSIQKKYPRTVFQ